jgi:Flp pilus assembly protein TadD
MLREQPDAAFLHFALGNNYASQSRWPEAQQAFFEAWRLQSDNPDYAYNLAVSLDQIGQAHPAMEYYRKALELADTTQVSFNTASVLARVNDLSANLR